MSVGNITQNEAEALVKLLILCTYEDKSLSIQESADFGGRLEEIPWDSGTALSIFVSTQTATVRAAIADPDEKQAFLRELCEQFESDDAQRAALSQPAALLKADGLSAEESSLMDALRALIQAG